MGEFDETENEPTEPPAEPLTDRDEDDDDGGSSGDSIDENIIVEEDFVPGSSETVEENSSSEIDPAENSIETNDEELFNGQGSGDTEDPVELNPMIPNVDEYSVKCEISEKDIELEEYGFGPWKSTEKL